MLQAVLLEDEVAQALALLAGQYVQAKGGQLAGGPPYAAAMQFDGQTWKRRCFTPA